jgi:hypothetical protein
LDCDLDWALIQINPGLIWCNRTRPKYAAYIFD